jgi:hypothetical protein
MSGLEFDSYFNACRSFAGVVSITELKIIRFSTIKLVKTMLVNEY